MPLYKPRIDYLIGMDAEGEGLVFEGPDGERFTLHSGAWLDLLFEEVDVAGVLKCAEKQKGDSG